MTENNNKKNQQPLVSICIPLYNKVNYIGRTLKIALAQTYQNLEIIISDNGSNDGSTDIVKEYMLKDQRIKYYRLANTISSYESWRYSLLLAQGQYITLLCADDYIHPNFISKMIAPLLLDYKLDFAVCKVEPIFENDVTIDYKTNIENYYKKVNNYNQILINIHNNNQKYKELLKCINTNYFGPISNFLYKRSCYPEKYWSSPFGSLPCKSYPDWDFLIRLHLNYQGYFVDDVLAHFSYNYTGDALNKNENLEQKIRWETADFLMPFTVIVDPYLFDFRNHFSLEERTAITNIAFQLLNKLFETSEQLDQEKIQNQNIIKQLNLKEINWIIFPDWQQSEEIIMSELTEVIIKIVNHPDLEKITLIIDNQKIDNENVNLLLSAVMLNTIIEIPEESIEKITISITGELNKIQWQYLMTQIQGRIVLNCEDAVAINLPEIQNLPIIDL